MQSIWFSVFELVGAPRFELGTPSPPDWCANRAALRSELRRTIVSARARGNRQAFTPPSRSARVRSLRRIHEARTSRPSARPFQLATESSEGTTVHEGA